MTGHGAKFGRKKDDAILALLTHRNVEEAAKSMGWRPRRFSDGCRSPNSTRITAKHGGTRSDNLWRGYNGHRERR